MAIKAQVGFSCPKCEKEVKVEQVVLDEHNFVQLIGKCYDCEAELHFPLTGVIKALVANDPYLGTSRTVH